ncbi:MAG: hypothetical protein HY667_00720 [Chloroflexi bacterium]|nr:hypothetical protein [Chloroflexota bacterium]
MRTLSSSLLAAQKSSSGIPYVKVEASNKIAGVVRLDWTRLYTGTEPDYFHAVTMAGDGSLIRARITPPSDSRKLYRQRVANPDPTSDFSNWSYTSQYNAAAVACAALGAEVSIFWINGVSREIYRIKSVDNGATWDTPELIDYSPTTAINSIAAAYKTNGDLAIFFADQATLYVKKLVSGVWQTKAAWDKTTDDLSGVACIYDGDWDLLVTGKDSAGNFMLWSLVYGDGVDIPAGNWSALKAIATAPSDGKFEYQRVYLAKPDAFRCFFVEKFTGTDAYQRPFWSHAVPGTKFIDNLWREPVPFNLSAEYGLALANSGDYCWLSRPDGVWRAKHTTQTLDLTGDVLSLIEDLVTDEGELTVELRNDNKQYASPGAGSLAILDIGCQLELSPGYRTSAGNESSPGPAFFLDAYEHTSAGGKASFFLYALDAWDLVKTWRARHQFRWNKDSNDMTVKQALEFVLARAGLKLEVKSQSSDITSLYPDFTIHPGNRGVDIIQRLLDFVPDVLFTEGNKGYLVNPQSADSSVYSYGSAHAIFEGKYRKGSWALNRAQVTGRDPVTGDPIVADSFDWGQINMLYDRLVTLEDRNLDTLAKVQARGVSDLRQAGMESVSSHIRIPVNCGQQLYDVIDITDSRTGLSAEKKRVLGLTMVYDTRHGRYEQRLLLGAP